MTKVSQTEPNNCSWRSIHTVVSLKVTGVEATGRLICRVNTAVHEPRFAAVGGPNLSLFKEVQEKPPCRKCFG